MGLIASVNHLLNFVAPAFFLAWGMLVCARIIGLKASDSVVWWAQAAINFAVGSAVLMAGLWWFGADAKMATYAMLVLSSALCQWVLSKGWD